MGTDGFLFSIFYEKLLILWLMKKIKKPQNEDLNILMVRTISISETLGIVDKQLITKYILPNNRKSRNIFSLL